ncbi:hypothetical protein [Marinobacter sp. P4B1]|uniref:hypothetical protein n=1 Tax=Marinobacter sp. P4B1 TaxID=1119533 RepID=UPI00071DA6F5|nr:hypothetical protein [Marinobacter sp. P4B1]KRW83747.1 hypothetical protein AQ621_17000 [Marinobacter sp. P4B1]
MSQNQTNISRPALVQNVTLDTPCAQKVFNRTFEEVLRNLYSLSIVARIVSADSDQAEELNASIKEKFEGMNELMDREMARLQKIREDNGITATPKYSDPLTQEVSYSSPMGGKFLQLILKLDQIAKMLDCLWLAEEFDDKQKLRGEYDWQRRLIKLANQVRDTYNRSRSLHKSGPANPADPVDPADQAGESKSEKDNDNGEEAPKAEAVAAAG